LSPQTKKAEPPIWLPG